GSAVDSKSKSALVWTTAGRVNGSLTTGPSLSKTTGHGKLLGSSGFCSALEAFANNVSIVFYSIGLIRNGDSVTRNLKTRGWGIVAKGTSFFPSAQADNAEDSTRATTAILRNLRSSSPIGRRVIAASPNVRLSHLVCWESDTVALNMQDL